MLIDAFTHMTSVAYLDKLTDIGGSRTRDRVDWLYTLAQQRPQALDLTRRIEQLDRFGIDMQVVTLFHSLDCNVLPIDSDSDRLAIAKAMNDSMGTLMDRSRGRLLCAASVPLASLEKGGLQEMERAIKDMGLKAVQLPSNIRGRPLDAPDFIPFWAYASELGIPVYIHPANPVTQRDRAYESDYDLTHVFGWPFETTLMLARLVFSRVMERYPGLKIVSHHLGGMLPFYWGRIEESYPEEMQQKLLGQSLPRPLSEYFRLFYYDTAVGGNGAAIKCAYDIFGAEQILFATDAPHGPRAGADRLERYPRVINSLGLSEGDKAKVLGGNAQRVFGLM